VDDFLEDVGSYTSQLSKRKLDQSKIDQNPSKINQNPSKINQNPSKINQSSSLGWLSWMTS